MTDTIFPRCAEPLLQKQIWNVPLRLIFPKEKEGAHPCIRSNSNYQTNTTQRR